MCSFSVLHLSWKDELLTWNTSQFGGITAVFPQAIKYWTPEIENTFSAKTGCEQNGNENYHSIVDATITNEGFVNYNVWGVVGAMCRIDMTYFPWDIHVCSTNYFSGVYQTEKLKIVSIQHKIIDEPDYEENQEWTILKSFLRSYNYTDASGSVSQSFSSSSVTIARRPGFVLIHNFTPAWLLCFLNLFVPLIPPDSERLSFSVTTYLAMIFINMTFIAEMPRSSIAVSLLSYNLLIFNITFTLGMIWNMFIVWLSKHSTESMKIPRLIKLLIRKKPKECVSEENSTAEDSDAIAQSTLNKGISKTVYEDCSQNLDLDKEGWYEVSRYFDRIYFILSLLLVTATIVVMCWLIFTRQTAD